MTMQVEIFRETEKAYEITTETATARGHLTQISAWVPKSQTRMVHDGRRPGFHGVEIEIPAWLYRRLPAGFRQKNAGFLV
jgi:hypothetical protein